MYSIGTRSLPFTQSTKFREELDNRSQQFLCLVNYIGILQYSRSTCKSDSKLTSLASLGCRGADQSPGLARIEQPAPAQTITKRRPCNTFWNSLTNMHLMKLLCLVKSKTS